jgi:hypothetical protein
MERLNWTSFIVLSTVLALVIQLLIINSVMAQAPNTSLAYNPNTSRIADPKNHTITVIDKKTNQPVSVCKFTPIEVGNTTMIRNVTACENLTPLKPTINETLTANTKNTTTTNESVTDKFNALQGK